MITDTISTFLYVKRLLSTGQQERNTEFTNCKRMRRIVLLNARVSASWPQWSDFTVLQTGLVLEDSEWAGIW